MATPRYEAFGINDGLECLSVNDLNALAGGWCAWEPKMIYNGNFAYTSGAGRYLRFGRLCIVNGTIIQPWWNGSTGTFMVMLPPYLGIDSAVQYGAVGSGSYWDDSAATRYSLTAFAYQTNNGSTALRTVAFRHEGTTSSSSAPFERPVAREDTLTFSLRYMGAVVPW